MLVIKILLILTLWIPVFFLLMRASGDLFNDILRHQRAERQKGTDSRRGLRVMGSTGRRSRPAR